MARPRLRLTAACPATSGSRRDEQGAIALEAAIVFLFLFTLLAGVVDVSLFFKDTYSVSSAARAGARMAAADPLSTTFARDTATQVASALTDLDYSRVTEIWVYKADPDTGDTMSGSTCGTKCVKFTLTAPGVASAGTGTWTSRNACASTSVDVDSVGVLVRYRHKAAVMFANNQIITERVTMRLEQIPSTQQCVSVP
ncbi:MAG: pilus assembly protein [Micrococcales bacterium]|uniref:TadE/TadG family type IV pilus assembly protein n=1 Tax=Phycicoccus sp. TaxID=1902410 RepID=UPI00198FF5E7|nr:TadE/TadG family type IV pilus assembly protein [Phycicoccus sp.]MBD3784223.1 pilus assembly protein [Micrococcales bacterium]HMM95739.1 TadE/TadG family type IV pilus assembly protein [Phycicoccus sp.]